MPEPDQDQDNQLTGDELSELHGLAAQLQAVGDPRADRVWKVIDAQTDRDADRVPGFRVSRSPLKVTSWLEDLENTLWGDQPATGQDQSAAATGDSTNEVGAAAQAPGDDQSTQQLVETEDDTAAAAGGASSDDWAAPPGSPARSDVSRYGVGSPQEMFGARFAAQSSMLAQAAGGSSTDALTQQTPASPEHGEGSKSNLAKRADIARQALGYDASTHWAFDTDRSEIGFGPKTNKCNVFVYDLAKEAGAEAKVQARKNWPMPVAEEWANRKFKLPNWRVLGPGETPQAGDVAAFPMHHHAPGEAPYTGHSGIIVTDANGKLASMSAHDDKVGPINYDQFLHEDIKRQPTVVFRRYTGD